MSRELVQRVLIVLGDGGTTEMAERVALWLATDYNPGVRPEDIGGLSEIAGVVGKSKQAVCNWIARENVAFPRPITTLAATKIWDLNAVRMWRAGNPDLTGD